MTVATKGWDVAPVAGKGAVSFSGACHCVFSDVFGGVAGTWLRDVKGIVTAYSAVKSGMFAGKQLYELCVRAELRLCALGAVSELNADVRVPAYHRLVNRFELALALCPVDYEMYSAQFLLTSRLYNIGVMPYSPKLLGMHDVPVACRVIPSSSVAVLTTSAADVVDKADLPCGTVVPQLVYAGFLRLAVDTVDSIDIRVAVLRRVDGVYQLLETPDPSLFVSYENLPSGLYELPGTGGLVSRAVVIGHIRQILHMPMLMRADGYCYLAVVPPELRVVAARVLGREPIARQLREFCSDVSNWSNRSAVFTHCNDGVSGRRYLHVEKPGFLPDWVSSDDVIGAARRERSVVPPVPSLPSGFVSRGRPDLQREIDNGIDNLLSSMAPRPRAASAGTVGGSPFRGRALSPSARYAPRPGLGSSGAEFQNHVRTFSGSSSVMVDVRPMTTTQTSWHAVVEPAVAEWSARFSSGAALGHAQMRAICSAKPSEIPSLEPPEGRSVFLPSGGEIHGCKSLSWSRRSLPVAGWECEYLKLRTAGWYCAVPAVPGAWTRYEFSFSQEVVVNGVTIPGRRTVVWVLGPIALRYDGGEAHLWRLYSNTGVGVLGPDFAVAGYSLLSVRTYSPAFTANRVAVLRYKSESPGRFKRYVTESVLQPGLTTVHLAYADAEPSGCVRVAVSGFNLMGVTIHGVSVSANNGIVEAVLLARQMTITVSLNTGVASTNVLFEVTSVENGFAVPVVSGKSGSGRLLLEGPGGLGGMSPVLPQ